MNTNLTPAQADSILEQLRSLFPNRTEYRYACVTLECEEVNQQRLLLAILTAAIDTGAIPRPSTLMAIDENLVALPYLVKVGTSDEHLGQVQAYASERVQFAISHGLKHLAQREQQYRHAN